MRRCLAKCFTLEAGVLPSSQCKIARVLSCLDYFCIFDLGLFAELHLSDKAKSLSRDVVGVPARYSWSQYGVL